jgi:hypothetical protein
MIASSAGPNENTIAAAAAGGTSWTGFLTLIDAGSADRIATNLAPARKGFLK